MSFHAARRPIAGNIAVLRRRNRGVDGVVGDWVHHLDAATNDYFIARARALMKRVGVA
jgi:hypothetical protein